jgi:hypothetical protein
LWLSVDANLLRTSNSFGVAEKARTFSELPPEGCSRAQRGDFQNSLNGLALNSLAIARSLDHL